MAIFILVRPGRTDFDEQHRIQGTLDVPLNAAGLSQLEHLASELTRMSVDRIHTSAGEPCLGTATRLGELLGARVQTWEALDNRDEGLWQGLDEDALRRKSPRVYRQREECPCQVCPPEGEPFESLLERAEGAVSKLLRKTGTMVIVAAEPVATVVSCLLRGVDPLAADFSEEALEPGGWEVVEAWSGQPGARLQRSNETAAVVRTDASQ